MLWTEPRRVRRVRPGGLVAAGPRAGTIVRITGGRPSGGRGGGGRAPALHRAGTRAGAGAGVGRRLRVLGERPRGHRGRRGRGGAAADRLLPPGVLTPPRRFR